MIPENTKKSRGRPPGSLKPEARRITMKLRWTEEEIEAVKAAASAAGEYVSHFIRLAALVRIREIRKRLDNDQPESWLNAGYQP